MRLIEIDCIEISLTGITFNSTFTVRNTHQILAVMFEFQSRPDCFEIEPLRGMILQGEKKIVKIRLKPEYRSQAEKIGLRNNVVFTRATYYCEYNKKLLEAHQLHGWSSISKQFEEINIPIKLCFGAEVQKLKESIRQGISLKNSRRQNSFQKFRDSSVKRVKNSKLNQDLDFLFRNEEYAKLKSNQRLPTQPNLYQKQSYQHKLNSNKYSPLSSNPVPVNSQNDTNPKVSLKSIGSQQVDSIQSKPNSSSRGFQLIVLAIIAAFFLAIGEAMGSLLK